LLITQPAGSDTAGLTPSLTSHGIHSACDALEGTGLKETGFGEFLTALTRLSALLSCTVHSTRLANHYRFDTYLMYCLVALLTTYHLLFGYSYESIGIKTNNNPAKILMPH
jgi:hypothetical protein